MGTAESPVRIGTTADRGCLIQLIGRCTMQHSPSVEELVSQMMLRDQSVRVDIDLHACTYLDSTFLGCLFGLYRRFVQRSQAGPRVRFYASPTTMKALFGPLHLDRILHADEGPAPAAVGPMVPMEPSPADRKSICKHVMECHRRLAETDTPAKTAFTKIADAMEQELAKEPTTERFVHE